MGIFDRFTRDNDEDNPRNDFFEETIHPEPPKPPREPELKPDDPRYWEREDSEWEHITPSTKHTIYILLGVAAVIIALLVAVYLRYFSPYVDDAVEYGYIEHIEHKGTVIKTYEGVMILFRELHDTTRVYQRDFTFSTSDHDVAVKLKQYELAHKPVRVSYRQYHATVPWRGDSKTIVTAVDSVDPRTILPPGFRPATLE